MIQQLLIGALFIFCVGCTSTETIKVVIADWQDPAGALPENDIYQAMRNYMRDETGKKLNVEQLPLSELAAADPSLLHLVGVDAVEVKPDEREAIQQYINAGGTILIENLGGTGEFVQSMRKQLGPMFPGDDHLVSRRSDIITGRIDDADGERIEGAKNNRRPVYRQWVLDRVNPGHYLLLRGYSKVGRYPILLSYEDISFGMLGIKEHGIHGYDVDTARNLMVNILLEASVAHPGSTVSGAQ